MIPNRIVLGLVSGVIKFVGCIECGWCSSGDDFPKKCVFILSRWRESDTIPKIDIIEINEDSKMTIKDAIKFIVKTRKSCDKNCLSCHICFRLNYCFFESRFFKNLEERAIK